MRELRRRCSPLRGQQQETGSGRFQSWEEAGRRAVETAASSLRDLRVAEVMKMDMKVEDGKVAAFRTRVSLSFKYEA
jgi:flavin-binding protein dodecin